MKTIDQIIALGAEFYSLPVPNLIGRLRTEKTALIRFSVMVACRQNEHTFDAIGKAFGRDHASVMHAVSNTTPEKFRGLWKEHLDFLERVGLEPELKEHVLSAQLRIENAISKINGEIESLARSKAKLTAALDALRC